MTPEDELQDRKGCSSELPECRNCDHAAESHDAGAEGFLCVCSECVYCDYEPKDRLDYLEQENGEVI